MNFTMPPSYHKPGKKLIPYHCGTCGNRACRRKWRVVCWVNCRSWKPEILPLDNLLEKGDESI